MKSAITTRPKNVWILGPSIDLVLFIATPILILPAFFMARSQFSLTQISLFVASFGALGHHLPGMIRAYGDRLLFRRFKYRFVVAPLLFGTTCIVFAIWELDGVVLVAYLWGVWHALMQTYGFIRIYDAKSGPGSRVTPPLDRAMCVAWFGVAVLQSPTRMFKIFSDYYTAGGPVVPATAIEAVVKAWTVGTAIVTLIFIGHLLARWLGKQGPNPIKLLLMATSFSFWWYSTVVVPNMLVGIALFEIFHDVQYLAIVWMFNLNRAERNPEIGRFTTFLFRRSGALAGVYIGLVAAYGSLNLLPDVISSEAASRGLRGLLVASALLHFYYDSFIWKVRERDTRESLGLAAREGERRVSVSPAWFHGLRWAPLVGVALWFALAAGRSPGRSELEKRVLIVAAAPTSDEAHNNLAVSLLLNGRVETGVAHLQQALRLNPLNADAHSNLGLAFARRGNLAAADAEYQAALKIDPSQTQTYANLANLLVRQGNVRGAIDLYEEALRLDPEDPQARTNLAAVLLQEGRVDEAIDNLERVLRARPAFAPAVQNLRIALSSRSER